MKKILIALCTIFVMSLGIQSYVYAVPAQGIKITTQKPSGGVKCDVDNKKVYAEIKNTTNRTISVTWTLTAENGTIIIGSGSPTIAPGETYTSQKYDKEYMTSSYDLDWSYN